jgi:tetratricopeptide (TPR) repeat protein
MRASVRHAASAFLTALLLLSASVLPADVLVMKDGKTIEGEVSDQGDVYEVKTKFGTLKVDKADVAQRVSGPGAMATEAETLRMAAKAMIDGAASVADPAMKARKLGAAIEILRKALGIYTKAREIFKGDAYAHLDQAIAAVTAEIRAAKGQIPAAPAPAPAAGTPAPAAAPATAGGGSDLLAPPPPPSSLGRAPAAAGTAKPETPETPPAKPKITPERALWYFLRGRKEALVGTSHEIRFAKAGVYRVKITDVLYSRLVVLGTDGQKHSVAFANVANESALAMARAALNTGEDPMRPQVGWFHARLGEPEKALDLYLRAIELGAPVDPDRLAEALVAFAVVAAGGVIEDFDGLPDKLKAIRERAGADAPASLKEALAEAEAGLKAAESLRPSIRKLAEARKAIERERFDDARYRLEQIVKKHPDLPLGEEAAKLLAGLPHPDGRLVNGFDTAEDLRRCYAYKGYVNKVFSFQLATEKARIREGAGAAHWISSKNPAYSNGGIVMPFAIDTARFRGISIWAFQPRPSAGRLEFAFVRPRPKGESAWPGSYRAEDIDNCIYRMLPLNWVGWRQFKFAAREFKVRGQITWRDVGRLVIYEPTRKGVDIVLDSLRVVEAAPK